MADSFLHQSLFDAELAEEGAGSEDDAYDDPGLVLGEDILSIRQRAVQQSEAKEAQKRRAAQLLEARRGPSEPGPGPDPRTDSPPRARQTFAANLAEQRREQIDLSAGPALSRLRLEDPKLAAHMSTRRELAAAVAEKASQLQPLHTLRADNKRASQGLSTVTLSLKDAIMSLRCTVEEVSLEADNAARLAADTIPHGYPASASSTPQDRTKHLSKKLAAAGKALTNLLREMEQAEADLTVARRLHDTTTAGLLQWAGAADNSS